MEYRYKSKAFRESFVGPPKPPREDKKKSKHRPPVTLESALYGRKNAVARPLPPSYTVPDNVITRTMIQNRELTTKLSHAQNELVALRALYAQVCQSAGLPQSVLDAAASIARLYGNPPTAALNPIEYRRMVVFYALEAKAAGANMKAFYTSMGVTHAEVCDWARKFRKGTPMRVCAGKPTSTLDPMLLAMTREERFGSPVLMNPADRQPPTPPPQPPKSIYQQLETPRQRRLALGRVSRYSLTEDSPLEPCLTVGDDDQGGDKCE